jgi:hypothetical protein
MVQTVIQKNQYLGHQGHHPRKFVCRKFTSRHCPFLDRKFSFFSLLPSDRSSKNRIFRSPHHTRQLWIEKKPCTSRYCPFRTESSGGFFILCFPQSGFLCLDGKEVAGEPRVSQSSSPIIHSIRDPSKEYRRSDFKKQFSSFNGSQCGSIFELNKVHQKIKILAHL